MEATRRLAALETELGVRLLNRTTRALSTTAEGEAFLPFANRIVEDTEAGKAVVASSGHNIQGHLRITSCGTIARTVVVPAVAGFLKEYPKVEIDLLVTDEMVDVVSFGIDVAVRIGELRDSNLTSTSIRGHPRALYASPTYLAGNGPPKNVGDLATHECLLLSGARHWKFIISGQDTMLPVSRCFSASSVESIHDACLGAAGIAVLSKWCAETDVASGRLIPIILQDATPKEHAIHALYPSGRHVLPKARLFVESLRSELKRRHTQ